MDTAPTAMTPLKGARDRLRLSEALGQACYDDLAAPDWASYLVSRARFLGRPEPRVLPCAPARLPISRGNGR